MDTTMTPGISINDVFLELSKKTIDLGKYQKAVRVKQQVKGLIQMLQTQFSDFAITNFGNNIPVETVQPVARTVIQEVKEPVATVSKIEVTQVEPNYTNIEATAELPNMESVKGHRLVSATQAFLGVIRVYLNGLTKTLSVEEVHNDIPSPQVEESIIPKVLEPEFTPYTQTVDLGIPSVVTNTVEVSEPTEKSNIIQVEEPLQNLKENNVELSFPVQEPIEIGIEKSNLQPIEVVLENIVEQPVAIHETTVIEPTIQNEQTSDAIKEDVSVAEVISNIRSLTEKVAKAEIRRAKDDQTIATLQETTKKQRENVTALTASNRDLESENKALQKQNQILLSKISQLDAEIVKVQANADQKIASILALKDSEYAKNIAALKAERANLINAFAAASSYKPAETDLKKVA